VVALTGKRPLVGQSDRPTRRDPAINLKARITCNLGDGNLAIHQVELVAHFTHARVETKLCNVSPILYKYNVLHPRAFDPQRRPSCPRPHSIAPSELYIINFIFRVRMKVKLTVVPFILASAAQVWCETIRGVSTTSGFLLGSRDHGGTCCHDLFLLLSNLTCCTSGIL
jgi:hypothetical protein